MRKPGDTRKKLLETAISLIWQSSYSGVGVAEICKQAGVTKGSFYHYFETKADLFCEASQYYWDNFKKDLDAVFSPSNTPLEQLQRLIEFILEEQEREASADSPVSGCPFFTSASQCNCGEEKVRQAAMEMSENALAYNTALVRNLKADGLLNGDPDPQQVGRLINQYIQGLLLYGQVYRSLDRVRRDLREGLYRLVDLKQEYRLEAPRAGAGDSRRSVA